MTIKNPALLTTLEVWSPRYKDGHKDEWVVLVAQYKVTQSSPIILIKFTKAKHLLGQRFAIKREEVLNCPLDSNGKIPCYAIPMSKLEHWETNAEVRAIALDIFDKD